MDEARIREIVREETGAATEQQPEVVYLGGRNFNDEEVRGLSDQINEATGSGAASGQLDDEAVIPFWDGVRRELDATDALGGLSTRGLEALRNIFCCVIMGFSKNVLEAVSVPTGGTGKMGIALRASPILKDFIARCAQDLVAIERHGLTPALVSGCTPTVAESETGRLPQEASGPS